MIRRCGALTAAFYAVIALSGCPTPGQYGGPIPIDSAGLGARLHAWCAGNRGSSDPQCSDREVAPSDAAPGDIEPADAAAADGVDGDAAPPDARATMQGR